MSYIIHPYIYISYIIYHISYIICVYIGYITIQIGLFFFENCPLEISTENSARLWNYDFSRSVMQLADAVLDLQHEPGRMGGCWKTNGLPRAIKTTQWWLEISEFEVENHKISQGNNFHCPTFGGSPQNDCWSSQLRVIISPSLVVYGSVSNVEIWLDELW